MLAGSENHLKSLGEPLNNLKYDRCHIIIRFCRKLTIYFTDDELTWCTHSFAFSHTITESIYTVSVFTS
ncbi:hypothetical protein K1T71_013161 [Dendrolimus kikuchii]|uniref:Uncharacterized protein n=1 Tax=Dendrolimus kikuchii TaxID=765133 RepID=A0ACC1CJ74_9NEOP|nr:hypothetical protein K1T71_013161 [Dendrolimus kikuchii]